MNQIPNVITSVRLFVAVLLIGLGLLATDRGANCFVPLFVTAGLSDMLDGEIARRFNWCSEFGATLDSVSDLSLYLAVLCFLWFNANAELAQVSPIFFVGLFIHLFHLAFAQQKFGEFPSYHSDFSRASAYLIFFGLLIFWYLRSSSILLVLASLWIACTCEGVLMTAVLKRARQNIPNITAARLPQG